MTDSDYWSTLAQVMPVVGVGLVLSGRYVTRQWTDKTPRPFKFCVAFIWGVNLVCLGVGESVALRALRGETPDPRWQTVCEQAVTFGVSVMFIGPALEFVLRANAEVLGKFFAQAPWRRLRIHLLRRSTLRYMVKVLHLHEGIRLTNADMQDSIDQLDRDMRDSESAIARLRTATHEGVPGPLATEFHLARVELTRDLLEERLLSLRALSETRELEHQERVQASRLRMRKSFARFQSYDAVVRTRRAELTAILRDYEAADGAIQFQTASPRAAEPPLDLN